MSRLSTQTPAAAPARSPRRLGRLVQTIGAQRDVRSALQCAAELVRSAIGCDCVVITRRGGTHATVHRVAAGSPLLTSAIDKVATAFDGGLAGRAMDRQDEVVLDDLDARAQWPGFESALVRHSPVRSAAGYHLDLGPDASGALVLYSRTPGFFTDERVAEGDEIAACTAVALAGVADRVAVANLRIALKTSREISTAVGIVMSACRVQQDQAFDLMIAYSQRHHLKVRDVAAEIVYTGQPPASR